MPQRRAARLWGALKMETSGTRSQTAFCFYFWGPLAPDQPLWAREWRQLAAVPLPSSRC